MKRLSYFQNYTLFFTFFLGSLLFIYISCQKEATPTPDDTDNPGLSDTLFFTVEGVKFSNGLVENIDFTSASINGSFSSLAPNTFPITQHGHVWAQEPNFKPELNQSGVGRTGLGQKNSKGNFPSELRDLKPGTNYYVRAYVESNGRVVYHKSSVVFRTLEGNSPVLRLSVPKDTTQTSFTIEGSVDSWGGANITQHGFIWSSTNQSPSLQSNEGKVTFGQINQGSTFSSNFTNLKPNTFYYVRAYALNSFGTGYSEVKAIKTKSLYVVDNGMIAYYTFEQTFDDQASGTFDGISNNVSFFTDSPSGIGYSAQFIPSQQGNIAIPLNPLFQLQQGSICFWLKSNKVGNQGILHANNLASGGGFNLMILNNQVWYNSYREYIASFGRWDLTHRFDNVAVSSLILDGNWHFVALTLKPGEHRIYIDGKLLQQKTDAEGLTGTQFNNGLIIGQFRESEPMYYNGNLDNLRLYGRVISESEVKEIYNAKQ